jgi:hypothetical protein
MTRIYFQPTTANPDGEPCVMAEIYSDDGNILAVHTMTIEGATIRMHDMRAAIHDAIKIRRARDREVLARQTRA